MILNQIFLNFFFYFFALSTILLKRKDFISVLIGIELLLLSLNLNFIFVSHYINDITGYIFSLFILAVAAAESSVGLSILLLSYKQVHTVSLTNTNVLIRD